MTKMRMWLNFTLGYLFPGVVEKQLRKARRGF